MKTRCRSYGPRKRMTVSSSVVSTQDSSERKDQGVLDSPDDILSKESQVIHETRSQKHAKVNGQHEEHAETKEPSLQRSELSSTNIRVSTRSSARPQKRQKKSNSSPQATVNQDVHQPIHTTPRQQKGKKVKRQWESWGLEDKNAFFEALHEHGKDFDKIQAHLLARHKRRGDSVNLIKNKDQVRHFYYRTLNKISKYIPKDKQPNAETDPHRRTVLELGGLTCYGELRKKGVGLGDKQGKKLYELLADGRTYIRYKGRTTRVKPPTCRALKKMTSSDAYEATPPPIPSKINIEFLPSDNATWLAVQRIAKNPRLRATVSSKKPLHIILEFLMKKWPLKSPTSKMNEVLSICITIPVGYFALEEEHSNVPCDNEIAEDTTSDDTANVENELDAGNKSVDEDKGTEKPESSKNQESKDSELLSTQSNSKESSLTSVAGSMEETTNPKQWTSESCGNITIGDIYRKLQRPPKLKLEYSFQEGEISATKHSHNSLKKLVDVAKNEFHSFKNRDSVKTGSENGSSRTNEMPAPSFTATRRKVSKPTNKLPFILPSIAPSALRQGMYHTGVSTVTTVVNSNPTPTFVNTRKRPRKNQLPVTQPQKVIQRTLLPRPANAMPRGAVAVSFIPQPVESISSVPSPMSGSAPVSDGTSRISSNTLSPKPAQITPTASPGSTIVHSPSPAQSPANNIVPMASPEPSAVITTVLETGIQQPALTNETLNEGNVPVSHDLLDSISVTLKESTAQKSTVGLSEFARHSDVDQFVNSLQQYTSSSKVTGGLESAMEFSTSTVQSTIQLDPVVPMNEDSGSELLASIMGLQPFTQNSTVTSAAPETSGNSEKPSDAHAQDMISPTAGCSSFSFSTPSFHNILSSSNNETIMSVSTTTASSLFFNTGSENCSDSFNTNGTGNLFTTPHLSPMLSPTTEQQWLNGEVADISLGSFLEKMAVSPEKDSKFGFETSGAALFANKDTSSQDSLFGSKSMLETSQAERALQAIMDENSVDFVKKFEDLTKQISNTDRPLVSIGENSSDSSNSSSGMLSFKNVLGSKT